MEYMPGGSLDTVIGKSASMKTAEKINLLVEIANGLADIHSVGVIHGDIKPQNILLDANKVAKLADFGLASISNATSKVG